MIRVTMQVVGGRREPTCPDNDRGTRKQWLITQYRSALSDMGGHWYWAGYMTSSERGGHQCGNQCQWTVVNTLYVSLVVTVLVLRHCVCKLVYVL
jgi:hypothetical protein